MADRKPRVLLVEPDPDILELLGASIAQRLDVHLTCVASAQACLQVEMGDPHDLIVAELRLEGMESIELCEQLGTLSNDGRPVILLAEKITTKESIRAMRVGVRDIFCKPFPVSRLLERLEQLLREYQLRRRHAAKYHRMRELVRRAVRERRELNRRTEFICRDLVGAHRRLVSRVLSQEDAQQVCE